MVARKARYTRTDSLSQIRSDLSMYSTCLPLARMRFSFFLIFAVRIGEPIVHVGSKDMLL